jgi:hypothetical protein
MMDDHGMSAMDPNKASCTCPVRQGAMSTLGADCQQDACKTIWSAATSAGYQFANQHFYDYIRENDPSVPVNKPAEACPVPPH